MAEHRDQLYGYSRRQFLRMSLIGASAVLVGCTQDVQDAEPAAGGGTAPEGAAGRASPAGAAAVDVPTSFQQAPELEGADLPPVAERLPNPPRAVPVLDEIGQYGGTWGRAQEQGGAPWGPVKLVEENALRWEYNGGEIIIAPNTVERWEQNDDATEFTWYIREGLKWSDGELFTTEDVQFWYDHYYPEGMMGVFGFLDGMELEVIDDLTYKTTFPNPSPLLPTFIAKQGCGLLGGPTMAAPAHYLSQYIEGDPNADQAKIDQAMEAAGVTSWQELHGQVGNPYSEAPITFFAQNPELPVLHMYTLDAPITANTFTMNRNPYYFVVDAEGNQLPYIDTVVHNQFQSPDVFNLMIAQGQIDMQERYTTPADFTFYKENESAGDYTVYTWRSARTWTLYPNLAHEDEEIRELLNNIDFRHAMSIAINRQEINNLIYSGQLTPRQACPVEGSPHYDEEWANKWTEYDPEGATALLDGIGLTKGGDGRYQRPSGGTLSLSILHHFDTGSSQADEVNRLSRYFQDIGLDINPEGVSQSLEGQRHDSNQVDIGYFWCDRSSIIEADPARYTDEIDDGHWAAPFYRFLDDGDVVKVEPPEDHPIREIYNLWEEAQVTADEAEREALISEMLDIHKENIFMIGTVGQDPKPVIVSTQMRNVANDVIQDDTVRDVSHINPMTFFMT